MFLKIFYYFTLVFLTFVSFQVFSASVCEMDGFSDSRRSLSSLYVLSSPQSSSSPRRRGSTGVESYRQLLVRLAQSSLGVDSLTSGQIKALETYHDVVRGEEGIDGTFARVGNYTFPQRRRIVKYLREVFTPEQVSTLIETGVVEINRIDPSKITSRKQGRSFREKKWHYLILKARYDEEIHQGRARLLEETDNAVLLEVEKIDTESGQIFKEHWYFTTDRNNTRFNSINEFHRIEIRERMDNGFVIRKDSGNEAFFSFKKAIENGLLPKEPTAQDYKDLEDMLNNFFSGRWDQIPALKEVFQKSELDKVEPRFYERLLNSSISSVYREFIALLDKSVIEDSEYYMKGIEVTLSPEMEAVYSAVQSTRRKIDINDLSLPVPTDRESQLAKQGYKASYIAGMDLVNQWVALRRQLQELKANPYTTHIEYFSAQIPTHIAHIRKGLENNYSSKEKSHGSKQDQLQKLKDLEKEAKQAERVTYKWWLEFNNKLTELMSGSVKRDPEADEETQRLMKETISYFPLKFVIPTIESGIGIMTFNRASLEGVYPAGVVNRQTIEADKSIYSSLVFLLHDHFHASLDGNQAYREYSLGHRLFHKRLLANMENLPPDKRKKAEAVYFIVTHEYEEETGNINISYSDRTPDKIRETVETEVRRDNTGILRFSADPSEKNKKVEDLADTFMEVYIQALQHQ